MTPYLLDEWTTTDDGQVRTVRVSGMVIGRVRSLPDGEFAADRFGKGGPTFGEVGRFATFDAALVAIVEPRQ